MQAAKRFVLIVFAVLGVLLVAGLVVAFIFGVLLQVLYVMLIILALLMIAATLFMIYSIITLIRTLRTIQSEMTPVLTSVQETVGIMKGTAQTAGRTASTLGQTVKLTGEWALAPIIGTVASVVAVSGMAKSLFGKGRARTRMEQRRAEQMEAMRAAREASARGEN